MPKKSDKPRTNTQDSKVIIGKRDVVRNIKPPISRVSDTLPPPKKGGGGTDKK